MRLPIVTFCLFQGQSPSTEIGRVYVYDKDDWDIADKTFKWLSDDAHPGFSLNRDTGMITMKHGVMPGKYPLKFKVQDRKHTQVDVPANVTVVVKEIPHEAVINSGSMRLVGITDEDFIRTWNWDTERQELSRAERFKMKLSQIMNVKQENVDVFSVMNHPKQKLTTDVRFREEVNCTQFTEISVQEGRGG